MSKITEIFKGFKKGFKLFGYSMTTIVNSILLFIVYTLGIGITSMVARIVGKSFLDIKLSKEKVSYWSDLNLKKKSIEEYYRQF